MKGSVNKTELMVFHKTDTASSKIKINGVDIKSKKDMSVQGIVFDSKLEWSLQVEKSVRKARVAMQGLRLIYSYFTKTTVAHIIFLLKTLLRF